MAHSRVLHLESVRGYFDFSIFILLGPYSSFIRLHARRFAFFHSSKIAALSPAHKGIPARIAFAFIAHVEGGSADEQVRWTNETFPYLVRNKRHPPCHKFLKLPAWDEKLTFLDPFLPTLDIVSFIIFSSITLFFYSSYLIRFVAYFSREVLWKKKFMKL